MSRNCSPACRPDCSSAARTNATIGPHKRRAGVVGEHQDRWPRDQFAEASAPAVFVGYRRVERHGRCGRQRIRRHRDILAA